MAREKRIHGQIALPYVLLISSIIVEIAVAGAFVAYFVSTGALGDRLSSRADATAYSGVYDAMRKIAENKEIGNQAPYCLSVGSDTVQVTIGRTTDTPANAYVYDIHAIAKAGTRYTQRAATLIVEKTTGEVHLQSITEEPVSLTHTCAP